jgi:hypothetical protein
MNHSSRKPANELTSTAQRRACLDAAKQWPDVDKLFRAAFALLEKREEGKP